MLALQEDALPALAPQQLQAFFDAIPAQQRQHWNDRQAFVERLRGLSREEQQEVLDEEIRTVQLLQRQNVVRELRFVSLSGEIDDGLVVRAGGNVFVPCPKNDIDTRRRMLRSAMETMIQFIDNENGEYAGYQAIPANVCAYDMCVLAGGFVAYRNYMDRTRELRDSLRNYFVTEKDPCDEADRALLCVTPSQLAKREEVIVGKVFELHLQVFLGKYTPIPIIPVFFATDTDKKVHEARLKSSINFHERVFFRRAYDTNKSLPPHNSFGDAYTQRVCWRLFQIIESMLEQQVDSMPQFAQSWTAQVKMGHFRWNQLPGVGAKNFFDIFPELTCDFAALLWRLANEEKEAEFRKNFAAERFKYRYRLNEEDMMPAFQSNSGSVAVNLGRDIDTAALSFKDAFKMDETGWPTFPREGVQPPENGVRDAVNCYMHRVVYTCKKLTWFFDSAVYMVLFNSIMRSAVKTAEFGDGITPNSNHIAWRWRDSVCAMEEGTSVDQHNAIARLLLKENGTFFERKTIAEGLKILGEKGIDFINSWRRPAAAALLTGAVMGGLFYFVAPELLSNVVSVASSLTTFALRTFLLKTDQEGVSVGKRWYCSLPGWRCLDPDDTPLKRTIRDITAFADAIGMPLTKTICFFVGGIFIFVYRKRVVANVKGAPQTIAQGVYDLGRLVEWLPTEAQAIEMEQVASSYDEPLSIEAKRKPDGELEGALDALSVDPTPSDEQARQQFDQLEYTDVVKAILNYKSAAKNDPDSVMSGGMIGPYASQFVAFSFIGNETPSYCWPPDASTITSDDMRSLGSTDLASRAATLRKLRPRAFYEASRRPTTRSQTAALEASKKPRQTMAALDPGALDILAPPGLLS
tara:strand:+ start:8625 stop:11210 length:2586 start_codon:yes stop_codon:yes gene_type:complete